MTTSEAIILAGGQGVRMRSKRTKTLQELGSKPMIRYIVDCARNTGFERIHIVYGGDGDEIRNQVPDRDINWVHQASPLGTGHAVQQAIPHVAEDSIVCVLYGDIPFIQSATVARLIELASAHTLALLTAEQKNPTGYGRIKRDNSGALKLIIEEKDASPEEKKISEVNAGPIAARAKPLASWLQLLRNENSQSEYYLTDVIGYAVADGVAVASCKASQADETAGVNSRVEQARLERILQMKHAERLMQEGVQLMDPARFDLRGNCSAGKDCRIDVNVIIEGSVTLADDVMIESNNVIRDSVLGPGVTIHPNCVIEGAEIGAHCTIGPFARIRPGTVIGKNAKVGNFVEIKASAIGDETKINHHAYIGDAQIGNRVNIGSGVVTCNYDGKKKHRTIIGDRVFIGSNCSLVAPIEILAGAIVGAGSTISKKVNARELVVERAAVRTFKRNR